MALYDRIDWKLLAQQKLQLFDLFDELLDLEKKHALSGVICMIDDMQDEAEKLGYPVVFTHDLQCVHCAGVCPVNYQARSGEVCLEFQAEMKGKEDGQLDSLIGLG